MFNLKQLIRDNIKCLVPYSSARDEFKGQATVWLDANENNFGNGINTTYTRYPDPYQAELKELIGLQKSIPANQIFLGNGSDECIDLLYRCFCRPGRDNIIVCPPTYGMYEVSANINDVEVRKAVLTDEFQPDITAIRSLIDENTKLIWLCSPNNPTGNCMDSNTMIALLENFSGLVVIDEAYIDFSLQASFSTKLKLYPNLVVLQTLSKAAGLAGLRVGMAFASAEIIAILNKVKPPYNISGPTQEIALLALQQWSQQQIKIRELLNARTSLEKELLTISFIEKIYKSDANFLLIKLKQATTIYNYLLNAGIVVRNRSNIILCEDCLRITIGTSEENALLLTTLKQFKSPS
jgi:histidinol-phosphate aminotransferase